MYATTTGAMHMRNGTRSEAAVRKLRAELDVADFPIAKPRSGRHVMELPAEGIALDTVERDLVRQALERTGWNQTRAAKLLGLNRDQIHYRIEKFKLQEQGESPDR